MMRLDQVRIESRRGPQRARGGLHDLRKGGYTHGKVRRDEERTLLRGRCTLDVVASLVPTRSTYDHWAPSLDRRDDVPDGRPWRRKLHGNIRAIECFTC